MIANILIFALIFALFFVVFIIWKQAREQKRRYTALVERFEHYSARQAHERSNDQ